MKEQRYESLASFVHENCWIMIRLYISHQYLWFRCMNIYSQLELMSFIYFIRNEVDSFHTEIMREAQVGE